MREKKTHLYFDSEERLTAILEDKTGIAVFYTLSMPVPTGVDELKRIQINLKVKEWRVK